jgi:predicted transglutaminase-like cysteine proteinase
MAGTWNDLLVEIDNDLAVVKMCREEHQSCSSKSAKKFIALAKEGKGQEGLAKIGHINRAATLAIKALGTAPAEWRSPLAILSSGRGDCKHYAVLKYALLRALGFSTDALRIVVVDVRSTHELHAIASVRTENGRWLILDNLTLLLVESSVALDRYDPLYELDQDGVRQFEVPSHSVQLAQALRAKGLSPFQHKEGL